MPKIKRYDWVIVPDGTKLASSEARYKHRSFVPDIVQHGDRVSKVVAVYDDDDECQFEDHSFALLADLKPYKVATASKELLLQISKDSVWVADEDFKAMPCKAPYGGYASWVTIPKGTVITVTGKKTFIDSAMFERNITVRGLKSPFDALPVRFFSHLRLQTAGKEKTYWMLLDKNDKPIVDKHFAGLSTVKSSVRYRCGKIAWDDNKDYDENPPEWLTYGADLHSDEVMKFDDWRAVHYRASDKSVIEVENLSEWWLMHELADKH